jgi:hypothetical protein
VCLLGVCAVKWQDVLRQCKPIDSTIYFQKAHTDKYLLALDLGYD